MSEQNNNSPTSSANSNNPTDSQSSPSAKPALEKWKNLLDIIAKLSPLIIAIGGAIGGVLLANHIQDKLSAANLLSQREQAETQLRANMFNNLMERIISKDPEGRPPANQMLLLAELLALNFDEHFQFKPLLNNLTKQKELKPEELEELESVARRIIDRQTDTLRAAIRTQGNEFQQDHGIQDIFTSDLFFKKSNYINSISYECDYIDATSLEVLDIDTISFGISDRLAVINKKMELDKEWVNKQQKPALFTNDGPSQCISVVSPDVKTSPDSAYLLDIAVLKYDPKEKTVTVSVNVTGGTLRSVSMVYEFDVTPFDFPLTDNTAIDSDHRFAIVQRNITEDNEIWLRLIWFPKGYITERERPINYSDMRELLKTKKESKKWYENWWSNLKNWWLDLPPPQIVDTTL